MIEQSHRSLVKAFSWRVTGTIDTMIISFLVTGRLQFAVSIGLIECFTKIALYYMHERVWNKLSFGRVSTVPGTGRDVSQAAAA